ncbi:MAG: WYL domain-containing protein [Candidatus Latescibacteria bacterium]|nr:WYL domain-containing protein [Candidatus Latescibacterota bacterium]NIM64406.1 WYL domain-containing protein [Candidatus Latescibacterota bacterium]NIO00560.1 WYL domain-containing protein [Candidatus Latescibacterota bacterium]NIO26960.1 WYL domain-containing protein [Candidatus Latescibacterota bacterium]NIO56037.1 WYL domain-containing protein [Candidatus Latescibacterota bacterium]
MSKKTAFDRYLWFHKQVKRGKYSNAGDIADRFDVSQKTAQRDIQFVIERLDAPLHYDSSRHGYYYTDDSFELPSMWLHRDEVIAFALAKRLAATIPSQQIKAALQDFLEKISMHFPSAGEFDLDNLEKKVTLKSIEYFGVDEAIFNKVLHALIPPRTLEIVYCLPFRSERTDRRIVPLHLLNYMGEWHIIAYCGKMHKLRHFMLSRVRQIRFSERRLPVPGNLPTIKEYIDKHFGVFTGKSPVAVSLRFSPQASRQVKEQVWHPDQKLKWDRDERLTLTIPVSDFREVKREVLKYGEEVEVLKPAALRREVMREIERMGGLYR